MATTLGQPSSPAPPGGPPSPEVVRSARAELARREDPRSRTVRLVILVFAAAVLVKGWLVTDIDLGKLANAPNAAPILKALVQPDIAARDVTQVELQVPFIVGAGSTGPASASDQAGQSLRIQPGSATPGQTVTFEGSGFAPDADGQLRIQNPSRGIDALFTRVHTDGKGGFHEERAWPDYTTLPADVYQFRLVLNAPTGSPHPSDTLVNSLGRMGETILLALMGTVFGVIISAPLSFLGARNLMGGTPIGRGVYWVVRLV